MKMALVVYVYKLKKATKKMMEDENFIRMYDEKNDCYDGLGFPFWARALETDYVQEFYDWDEYKERTGIDVKACEFIGESYGEDGWTMTVKSKNGQNITIDMNEVNTIKKPIRVIGYQQMSQQSGLFKENLYDDLENGNIGRYMWRTESLCYFMEKYCQDDDGEYSFKDKFKKEIIDKFDDGRMCVYISW